MRAPAFFDAPNPQGLALLLAPLGALYGAIAARHGNWRAAHAYYAAVPVIGVGNLVMGGSGKTPLVAALAKHYAGLGIQVAIVMRGYGGTESRLPLQVTFQHAARQVGDEAAMLFQQLPTRVQVWVGRHRPSVVKRAEQAGAQLILLDDAFQRRDVARDANVLVLYGAHPFGNGLCLPAGPLREPLSARVRADFAIHFSPPPLALHEPPPFYGITTYRLHVQSNSADCAALQGQRLLVFAGLGQPEKFFNSLKVAGLNVVHTLALPDHAAYPPERLSQLQALAKQHKAQLVTTAKDAIKLPPHFAHVVGADVVGADWENCLEALTRLIGPLPSF